MATTSLISRLNKLENNVATVLPEAVRDMVAECCTSKEIEALEAVEANLQSRGLSLFRADGCLSSSANELLTKLTTVQEMC